MIEVYGLTGKTGAGKSTVAKILCEKGFFVIDGDAVARKVTMPGSKVLEKLALHFGADIIAEDGTLKRSLLAERAFKNEETTVLLNKITHGAIDEEFARLIAQAEKDGYRKCVIDAAALLESPSKKRCEKIIVVTAPEEIRLERILKRDSLSKKQAQLRINAQKSDEYYCKQADIIIRNYPPYDIKEETDCLG